MTMDVRSQISMVFHLDKCLGCHTCSVACKNIWTDRKGAEYMWWNNVETKPGTGYPTCWEDQAKYRGGWEKPNGELRLKSASGAKSLFNIFHHPHQPTIREYYEPWTYDYEKLFSAPLGNDQPVARPVSAITGKYVNIEAGPNWDDDLGGSSLYAANDPNLQALTPEQRKALFDIEQMVFFHLPRTCNHCLNPACVAACPSGATYKRGEDGIVLVDQDRCRGWRYCVPACPYKKAYFNWNTGKSEKCILCYPRLESGQAPACYHSCVGRIRYLGVLLYDADRIHEIASLPKDQLVEGQRQMVLDPFDPAVMAAARASGISEAVIQAAQKSPVFRWVKQWKLALPLHIEYRTLPMLFYVPPMSPVMATKGESGAIHHPTGDFFHDIDSSRVPLAFLASLFAAGDQDKVRYALRKQKAVRWYRRAITAGDVKIADALKILDQADCGRDEAEAIYGMTTLANFEERFVIPPMHREQAIEMLQATGEHKGASGFGSMRAPKRGL
jgi:nitrate reductase beta subunit